jgi:hypothetical protein
LRLFSRASSEEQLLVRIDDKLSRIRAMAPGESEDVVLDLAGYLVLLMVVRGRGIKQNEKLLLFGIRLG